MFHQHCRRYPAGRWWNFYYRGYNVKDIIAGIDEKILGFEEGTYLLLAIVFQQRRTKRIHEHAEQIPHTAYQFCTRHHHESAEQGYDEHPCAECVDTLPYDDRRDDISLPKCIETVSSVDQFIPITFCLRLSGI